MSLTDKGKYYLLIAALSFSFSYLIITIGFFPHFGFAASLSAFAVLSYLKKKEKHPDTKIYFAFTLLFSLFLFVRSDPLTTFFNLCATIFFGLLMLSVHNKKGFGFLDYLTKPLVLLVKSLFAKSDYFLEYKKDKKTKKKTKIIEVVSGVLISLFLLVIILPLLSSANPLFQKALTNIWSYLNLENLINSFYLENLFVWIIRLIFFIGFVFMLPRILTVIGKESDLDIPFNINTKSLPLTIPKVVVAIVLFLFFITQLQFYFANDAALTQMGISYSEHTREVFGQLSIVAAIVLILIYNGKGAGKLDRTLNWILGIEGVFLTLMAYKSVFEYIGAWGLTYKRLYGLTFATWLTGIFVIFKWTQKAGSFIYKSVLFSALILILVNLVNFDYLIYNYGKAETGQGIDYTYLSRLSPDSLSYRQQFEKLQEVNKRGEYTLTEYNNENPLIILNKIEKLQEKYENFDLRTLSIMDYLQYLQIQDLDTTTLREYYTKNPVKFP